MRDLICDILITLVGSCALMAASAFMTHLLLN